MARFSAVGIGNAAGSTTLPAFSVFASATKGFWLRALTVINTTATGARYKLVRLSARGTPGAAITEAEWKDAGTNFDLEAFTTHSVAPTVVAGDLAAIPLGASVGARQDLQFADPGESGEKGIYVPPGTGNGLGVLLATGTGQVTDIHAFLEQQD